MSKNEQKPEIQPNGTGSFQDEVRGGYNSPRYEQKPKPPAKPPAKPKKSE